MAGNKAPMPQPLFIRSLQPRGWTQRPVQGDGTL